MEKSNTFVFFLMTEKGLKVLESLVQKDHAEHIESVVIGRDKNVQNDYSLEMESICKKNDIPYTFDKNNHQFKSTYFFCIGWRWLIKNTNEKTVIVFHESLLPRYRGFAPLVNQLINKEERIGVSALIATKNMDEGPILGQIELDIKHPLRIQEAIEKVTPLYQQLANEITTKIEKDIPLEKHEQNHSKATYSLWRDNEDYQIDWTQSAEKIQRHIYAVGYPYAGASTKLDKEEVRVLDAEVLDDLKFENRMAGKVFMLKDGFPIVVCGSGLLKITNAIYEGSQKSVLPLKKLRYRFQ